VTSTIRKEMLRLESPSGKCTKQQKRSHAMITPRICYCYVQLFTSLDITCHDHYYCLFAPHINRCCSSHTSQSWWIAHSTQRQPRGCNRNKGFGLAHSSHIANKKLLTAC